MRLFIIAKKLSYFCVLIFAVFFPACIRAQQHAPGSIDSLLRKLATAKGDTNEVLLLDKLSFMYSNINPDSGIIFGKQALFLAEEIGWGKGIAVANADLGFNYKAKSDNVLALKHELAALQQYKELGLRKSVAAMLCNLALIYHAQGDYTMALQKNMEALKIFEEEDNKQARAIILENIGTLFLEQKDYKKTIAYYAEAMDINKTLADTLGLARNYGNLGIVHDAQGNYLKALDYHLNALKINRKLDQPNSIQINLANVGLAYYHMKQYSRALKYHFEALQVSKALNSKPAIAINSGNIGVVYLTMAKKPKGNTADMLERATKFLENAVTICREVSYPAPLTEFMPNLSEAYAMSGNYKRAYTNYMSYTALKDSFFSEQTKVQISNLQFKRQMDIQQKNLLIKDNRIKISELEVEQQRNSQILYVMGIIVLSLILAITIKGIMRYRQKNLHLLGETKEREREIEAKDKLLDDIAYAQSHDIRGHVATILGLVQIYNHDSPADPSNKIIVNGISHSAQELDNVIKTMMKKDEAND